MSSPYASLAVFDLVSESKVAISTISITTDEVVLSGAWVLDQAQEAEIALILSDRLAIPLSSEAAKKFSEDKTGYKKVSLAQFVSEAKSEANLGRESFDKYKNEDLKKRKNLVAPEFYEWASVPDLMQSESHLDSFGLVEGYEGTAPEMRQVLAAARVLQYLILKWKSDELSRSGRKYVEGENATVTILPKSWLA
jgi:hypothetical protein